MNRRRQVRVAANIPVDVRADGHFLYAYITNISEMGLFIRTANLFEVGTRVHLSLSAEGHPPLGLEGAVAWVNPVRLSAENTSPGMGVKFDELPASTRTRLVELVRTIAYVSERHCVQ